VADLLQSLGYRDVERVGGAGDRGVDITCVDPAGRGVAVQCKQYRPNGKVGSKDMQNFVGMITRFHRSDLGLFVTTAGYTSEAQAIAHGADVEIIDGPTLGRMYRPLLAAAVVRPPVIPGLGTGTRLGGRLLIGSAICSVLVIALSRAFSDDDDASPRVTFVAANRTVISAEATASASLRAGTSARVNPDSDLLANVSGDRKTVGRLVTGVVVDITGPPSRDRAGVSWLPVTVQRSTVSGYVLTSSLTSLATPVAVGTTSALVVGSPSPLSNPLGTPSR